MSSPSSQGGDNWNAVDDDLKEAASGDIGGGNAAGPGPDSDGSGPAGAGIGTDVVREVDAVPTSDAKEEADAGTAKEGTAPKRSRRAPPAKAPAYLLRVTVSNPLKQGSGMSTHVMYSVTTETDLPHFNGKHCTVSRRYSDFTWLREALRKAYPGCIVPPLPDKQVLNRFEDDFLSRRGKELQIFLDRTASHPFLHKSQDLALFCMSQDKLPWEAAGGWLSSKATGLFGKVASSVKNYTMSPGEDPDPWFAESRMELDNWATQLSALAKQTASLAKVRMAMGQASKDFAKGANNVGSTEEHEQLAAAMNKLGDVANSVANVYIEQATRDITNFEDRLEDYIRFTEAAKEAHQDRVQAYGAWVAEQKNLSRKSEAYEKLAGQPGKESKAKVAKDEITKVEASCDGMQRAFEEMTEVLKGELLRFENLKVTELKAELVTIVKSFVEAEDKLIENWETLKPEVKLIES